VFHYDGFVLNFFLILEHLIYLKDSIQIIRLAYVVDVNKDQVSILSTNEYITEVLHSSPFYCGYFNLEPFD